MFLNPWYGAGPATEDAATTTKTTECEEATLEMNKDDAIEEDASTISAATSQKSTTTTVVKTESENQVEGSAPPPSEQSKTFQNRLKCGWTAHMTQEGRLFYCK